MSANQKPTAGNTSAMQPYDKLSEESAHKVSAPSEGHKPDMSNHVSQQLQKLSHIQFDDFRGHDLGIPLKPPPRP
ncbi:hypothetical protein GCK72_024567 [Caenorhabditis remanei]|uniref:Uncharacterized protein n=1 Tax=Caenorhabditis remanei TaxID=31234 RepID=A0A6A5FZM7_CAERE|nr:hypothetical protein GCK72_024567 [Caenorhabditis remanei]KAF1748100.1 hypothetical protein GCK72_024567 [Caenorhabditis remanei]